MRYSCGSLWSTLRSAGIATALAASSTWSRSPGVTSRSRIAAVPCELRVSRWLPEIDANTERMSQPAISSASSTARWIECTVDSMSTTEPRLSPRETCEPMPITSIGSPGSYSPTIATTLEVPISSPTTSCLSLRVFIGRTQWGSSSSCAGPTCFVGGAGGRGPAHGKTVGVAQVGVGEAGGVARHDLRIDVEEAAQPAGRLLAVAQHDLRAIGG